MGFWSRLFKLWGVNEGALGGNAAPQTALSYHAVLIHIPTESEMPTRAEMLRWHGLQRVLERTLNQTGVGELDGDEWGGGECTIYCYGPNADDLWHALRPHVLAAHTPSGTFITKRYGRAGEAMEVRVSLEGDGE